MTIALAVPRLLSAMELLAGAVVWQVTARPVPAGVWTIVVGYFTSTCAVAGGFELKETEWNGKPVAITKSKMENPRRRAPSTCVIVFLTLPWVGARTCTFC